jgi:hemerythrin-like domain-containing protein
MPKEEIMAMSAQYRNDHKNLVAMITDIASLTSDVAGNAEAIAKQLAGFSGKLKMHLATEDNAFYPQLINSGNDELKAVAEKFQAEMGGLKDVYTAFASKYITKSKIEADPAGFKSEFDGIVKALSDRINREENELYKLADEKL